MKENMNDAISYFANKLATFDDETLTAGDQSVIYAAKQLFGDTPKIAMLEELLSFYKEARNYIVRSDLPLALAEAGLTSANTDDGISVTIDTIYETKQLDKVKVASWLEESGYSDIIKDTLLLPKGAFTPELESTLAEMGVDYSRDSTINGMQLKSVVKKHIEEGGANPPADAMALSIFVQAKIKAPKITM